MAQGHSTAANIDFVFINSQGFDDRNGGCRKGLINFEEVDILKGEPRLFEDFWNRMDGSDQDILQFHTCRCLRSNLRQGLHP